mgnify:CR=1 FL=1
MNQVEHFYNKHLDRMTGAERVARTCELLEGVIAMIEHQIRKERPDIPERELIIRTAEILYLNDPEALRLLKLAREHGPA